ncbi:MAG TPA: YdcF family protein [Gammaproteobacteria bacterium]|nr:YdcF family protein [Gammaproteobacteria bacterium]
MDFYLINAIKAIILPPGNVFLLFLASYFLVKYKANIARRFLLASCIFFYLMSMPLVSKTLIRSLEDYPPLTQSQVALKNAQAIVILGGGRSENPEYGTQNPFDVSASTLQRLRYGAFLHSQTGLPILLSGGKIKSKDIPEGKLMAKSLKRDFKITAQWQENRGRNTAENAINSREILTAENIHSIFLVTTAWHMARAVDIFEQQGFKVIPAPTDFKGLQSTRFSFYNFVPSGDAIENNYIALREFIGRAWYFIRY